MLAHLRTLILWCAFAGSWLLVAGPLHQGTIELEQETQRDRRIPDRAQRTSTSPPSINPWWWLLPPIAIVAPGAGVPA